MKFMLQVRFNEAQQELEKFPAPEQQAIVAEYIAISETPGVLDGNQLQPASTATTVRMRDGQIEMTPGPPVDPAGVLLGYYLYDAPDLSAALELAGRIPAARMGGTVEVRPVVQGSR